MANEENVEWDAEIASLLEAEKDAPAIDPSIRDRVFERIQESVNLSPEPGQSTGVDAAASGGLNAVTASWWVAGVALVTGAIYLGIAASQSEPVPKAKTSQASSTPAPAETIPQVTPKPAESENKVALPAKADPANDEAAKAPMKARAMPEKGIKAVATQKELPAEKSEKPAKSSGTEHSKAVPPAAAKPSARKARRDMRVERGMLDKARSALRIGELSRAKRLLKGHERRFPRGFLAEERSSLMIRVLVKLGNKSAAERKAKRFLKRYPKSLQRKRVEDAVKTRVPSR